MPIESTQEFSERKKREKEEQERKRLESQAKHEQRQTELEAIKAELPSLLAKIHTQLKKDVQLLSQMDPPIEITIDNPSSEVLLLKRTIHGQLHVLKIETEYHSAWEAYTIARSLITDPNGSKDELQIKRQGSDTVLKIGTTRYSFKSPTQLAWAVGYLIKPLRGE